MNLQISPPSPRASRSGAIGYGHDSASPASAAGAPEDASGEIDIRSLLLAVWRRKVVLIVSMLLFGLLGLLGSLQSVPVYSAASRVLIDPESLNVVNVDRVASTPRAPNRDNIQNQVEIVRSTALLGRLVDSLQLDQTPEFNPSLRGDSPSLLDRVFDYIKARLPKRSDLAAMGIAAPAERYTSQAEEAEYDARTWIIQAVRRRLWARPLTNSQVIEIGFTSTDPHLAARIANGVAEQFILEQVEAQLQATRTASSWLAAQAETLQARVREAEHAVQTVRAELTQAAGSGAQVTAQHLQAFVGTLTTVSARRSTLQVRLDVISQALEDGVEFGIVPEFRASPIMEEYRRRLSSLRDEEVALRTVRSADLVELRVLEARVADVTAGMQLEANRIVKSLASEVEAAKEEERAILNQIATLEQKALEQAREELRLRELEREAEAARRLYETVFARLNEISLQETFHAPGARLLTPAEPATSPDTVSARLTVMMASMGGLLFGLVFIYLLERLNNTFRAIEETENSTGHPVLATIPKIGRGRDLTMLLDHLRCKPTSPFAEALRNLRTSILLSNIDSPPKVVMVTSSLPAEGKSTVSYMLALTSQHAGKSTVIVDCDLRRPALRKIISQQGPRPDLFALLNGTASLENAVWIDPASGLHLLATQLDKNVKVSAADILTSERFAIIIQQLRERYDLVILDTPPILLVTDSRLVATVADSIIFAVSYGQTPKPAVAAGLRELRGIKAPLTGLVLTLVSARASRRHGAGGYEYPGRRYKEYYGT